MNLAPRLRAIHFALLLLFLLIPAKAFASYSFSVTGNQIQKALFIYFPLNEYAMSTRLTLYDPVVTLKQGASHLQLVISVKASISGEGRRRGRVVVDVGLHYKSSTGELFLGYPKLRSLEMEELTDERRTSLRESLSDVLIKTLPMVRIYRVHEKDLNHTLLKSEITATRIENGVLRVTIGFD